MATYAIGDVQGCFDALQALLLKIHFDPTQDVLWFCGDLVNRGPDSLQTLRFVKSLEKKIVVLGNHDLHLLAVAYGTQPQNAGDTIDDILQAPDGEELLTWLRQQPLFYQDEGLNFNLVHAGIPPQWTLSQTLCYAQEVQSVLASNQFTAFIKHMYGNEPLQWSSELQGWDRLRYITNALTRLRFCTPQGQLDLVTKEGIDKQLPGYLPWFAIQERCHRQDNIVFGHWASLLAQVTTPHVFALDAGCVWGGSLLALRLEDQRRYSVLCQSC